MPKQPAQLRHFVFTYNNPTHSPEDLWRALEPLAKYLIFQKEVGANGTPHFQGYCELKRRTRFPKVKAVIPTAHIEPRHGTQAQARSYASKEETRIAGPFEFGDFVENEPRSRNDLKSFRDAIRAGSSMEQLLDDFPTMVARYPKFITSVRSTLKHDIRLNLRVELYYGAPGTGKTRKAFEDNSDLYVIPISDTLWFDGYDNQRCLLLDDFTGWMKLDHLLRLLDIYKVQIPVKGGFVHLSATKIVITSNKHPLDWYDWTKHGDVKYQALLRRIHNITHFTSSGWSIEKDDPPSVVDSAPPSEDPEPHDADSLDTDPELVLEKV